MKIITEKNKSMVNTMESVHYSKFMFGQDLSSQSIYFARMRRASYMLLCGLILASCTQNIEKPITVIEKDNVTETSVSAQTRKDEVQDTAAPSENAQLLTEIDDALKAYDDAQKALLSDNATGAKQDEAGDDVIASIIWEIEQSDNQSAQTQDSQEVVSFEDLIPVGKDKSLEKEALDAAFAMLRAPEEVTLGQDIPNFTFAAKQIGQRRLGVFVPRTGAFSVYGRQVIDGIEMALFQLNDSAIEVLYFDSSDTDHIPSIAAQAIEAEIDIAIGPLFSQHASAAYPYFAAANIPVLSLSNNASIARSGLWILGLVPEQQMDTLLAEAILTGHDEIAILSDQSAYGSALTKHVVTRLQEFGISPATVMVVDGTVGADDAGLVASLKSFAQYKPLEDDELIQDVLAPYDSVILAGGADFVLKVAPLLSYYDLGPDRVSYLGTDLWASAGLLGEPSLQGAYIATTKPELRARFGERYQALYQEDETRSASFLSQLGFDAMAIAASATHISDDTKSDNQSQTLQSPIITQLITEAGFKGYTGAFRLVADGRNNRTYHLFQVSDGALVPQAMTPKAF